MIGKNKEIITRYTTDRKGLKSIAKYFNCARRRVKRVLEDHNIERHTSSSSRKREYCDYDLYNIWTHIKSRCFNPEDVAFHNYGGRGSLLVAVATSGSTVEYDFIMLVILFFECDLHHIKSNSFMHCSANFTYN